MYMTANEVAREVIQGCLPWALLTVIVVGIVMVRIGRWLQG